MNRRSAMILALTAIMCVLLSGLAKVVAQSQPATATTKPAAATAAARPSDAEKQAAKEKDIRRMLQATGAAKLGLQVMDQMITYQKKSYPYVSEEFWVRYRKGVDIDKLVDMIVPLYEKHFTHDEIKGLIRFHESPLGKKVIKVQPMIMQESMQVGYKWGKEIAEQLVEQMKEEASAARTQPGEPL